MRTIGLFFTVLLLLILTSSVQAQTSTPAPTPDPLDNQDIYSNLDQANHQLDQVPSDLTSPGGPSLLPSADGHEIFAYAKWLLSTSSEDLFGPFAPIFVHLGIVMTLTVTLGGIYVIVWVVAYIIRFVIFLVRLILQVASALSQVASAILSAGAGAIGALLGFLGL